MIYILADDIIFSSVYSIKSYFFWQKQNDIHSFKSIKYINTNIAKNVNGESANKLTSSKLIAYYGKMPTNNMIKPKSPKYPYFRICNVDVQIIGWICNWLMSIFQLELNEHRDKTHNQTSYKATNNTTPHLDNEITKGKTNICENRLFRSKEKGKKDVEGVILGQKWPKITPSRWTKEKERLERSWSFSH